MPSLPKTSKYMGFENFFVRVVRGPAAEGAEDSIGVSGAETSTVVAGGS
ncbi:MAG: hypothetical protein ACK5V3_11975 [Bdellovibrionales bacterium]